MSESTLSTFIYLVAKRTKPGNLLDKMKPHANSHQNEEYHHLYEIYDTIEETVYKYGISCEPLYPDGSSPRANRQIRAFNRLVGYLRFLAKVLRTGIAGRKTAEEIEEEVIAIYEEKHGKRPRGNS